MKWVYVVWFLIMYVSALFKVISYEFSIVSMLFLFSIIYLSKMR